MAGGYTHLTLVRSALARAMDIDGLDGVLADWGHFTYMGGVSPDYPYLAMDDGWADLMHKGGTDRMIRAAMPQVFAERRQNPDGDEWRQKLAWLLGFTSHVVADATIHPVVNIKVGKYEEHKTQHRVCEMNQDVFVYSLVTGLDLHKADNMKTEILRTTDWLGPKDVVKDVWQQCFDTAYGRSPGSLRIGKWNLAFLALVRSSEQSRAIPVLGRKLVDEALAYPANVPPDSEFCFGLQTPSGKSVDEREQPLERADERDFDAIFQKALDHIVEAWTVVRDDLFNGGDDVGGKHLEVFGDWSLDTGIDNRTKQLRLWPFNEKLVRS